MFSAPVVPPSDGSVSVVPGFIDFQAQQNAERPWVIFPSGSPVECLSYKDFADATHRVAGHLRPHKLRGRGEVVALIIHCDVPLYLALVCGLVRAGYIPFLMGPKNSVPAFINLLEKTSCHKVITQPAFSPLVQAIKSQLAQQGYGVEVQDLPSLHDVFPKLSGVAHIPSVEPFPMNEVPHSAEDIVMYLHSSGSTGYPKPVPQQQNFLLEYANNSVATETRKHAMIWSSMALPTFHSIAILMQLLVPLSCSQPVCLFYPVAPGLPTLPTPEALLEACKATPTNGLPAFPAFFEYMAQSEESMKYLASLKIVGFAGGNLSEQAGATLRAAGVHPFAVYGGTEFGAFTMLQRSEGAGGPDWEWMAFDERVRCRWIPQGDGLYELHFLTCETHHPAVENLRDVRGYATGDLFIPHTTQRGLWKVIGRKDDIIVLNIGEKIAPVLQEGVIASSTIVAGCVMFGRGKSQCGVLIEPVANYAVDVQDEPAIIAFRRQLWPAVEKANSLAPGYARIFKEMILISSPTKPLPRASKGTVIRAQALTAYNEEIEALYTTVANSSESQGIPPPTSWDHDDILPWLAEHCASINDNLKIDSTKDLFDQGFDSLHTTFLRNRILAALRSGSDGRVQKAASHISPSFIFEHPTLHELAKGLAFVIASGDGIEPDLESDIKAMLNNYANHLSPANPSRTRQAPTAVLLIGSNGALGAHILAALLHEPRIHQVYTLNRSSSHAGRQVAAFRECGLSESILDSPKLVQLCGDFTEERLALEQNAFEQHWYVKLRETLTHIILNAWRVDVNLPLSSFERYIAGTRRLVDWCCAMERPARLFFTSSVSSAQRWDRAGGPVPERILSDASVATANGYGASKFVAEHLLTRAAERGLECTVLRLGQTCGPRTTGAWAPAEWVPILVKSSLALGALPDLDGNVSWIPTDAVASIVMDLVLSEGRLTPVLNVVHPRPVSWRSVFEAFSAKLQTRPLPLIPYTKWLHALEEASTPQDLERIPAIKILQFFKASVSQTIANVDSAVEAGGLPLFTVDELLQSSASATKLEPLDETYVGAWTDYWRRIGYIDP